MVDVSSEVQQQFANDFWLSLSEGSGIGSSLNVAQNRAVDQMARVTSDLTTQTNVAWAARQNFERGVLHANPADIKEVAHEQLQQIYQERAKNGNNSEYRRYDELVWYGVANKNENLEQAIHNADQYWGDQNNRAGAKSQFAQRMNQMPDLVDHANALEQEAKAKGFANAEERRYSEMYNVSPHEKHVLDEWARQQKFTDPLQDGRKDGFSGIDDYSKATGWSLQEIAKIQGQKDIHELAKEYDTQPPQIDQQQQAKNNPAHHESHASPVATQLTEKQIKDLQLAAGLSGDKANGKWNEDLNDQIRHLTEKAEANPKYAEYAKAHGIDPRGDAIYGKGVDESLKDMASRGQLSPNELKLYQALHDSGNGDPRSVGRQLAKSGYNTDDHMVQAEIQAIKNQSAKPSSVVAEAQKPTEAQKPAEPPVSAEAHHEPTAHTVAPVAATTATSLPKAAHRPAYRTVIPTSVVTNMAVNESMGHSISGVNDMHVKNTSDAKGEHVTVVDAKIKDAHGHTEKVRDTYAHGPDGAIITHTVKEHWYSTPKVESRVVMDAHGRVVSDQHLDTKGHMVEQAKPATHAPSGADLAAKTKTPPKLSSPGMSGS